MDATPGRIIFNERIPQDLGFVDRSDPDKKFDLEIDVHLSAKKQLGKIIDKCIHVHGFNVTAEVLDSHQGAWATNIRPRARITVAVADMLVPDDKASPDRMKPSSRSPRSTKQYKPRLLSRTRSATA